LIFGVINTSARYDFSPVCREDICLGEGEEEKMIIFVPKLFRKAKPGLWSETYDCGLIYRDLECVLAFEGGKRTAPVNGCTLCRVSGDIQEP
jgi:hypothetical protein